MWGRWVRGLDPRELRLPVRADVSESVETEEVTTTCRVTMTAQVFRNQEESRDTASRNDNNFLATKPLRNLHLLLG